eukprot:6012017-Amphidinium_carterae.1
MQLLDSLAQISRSHWTAKRSHAVTRLPGPLMKCSPSTVRSCSHLTAMPQKLNHAAQRAKKVQGGRGKWW